MQAPDPIETILARLMPPALSEGCAADLGEMLDELAGGETAVAVPPRKPSPWRWAAAGGIAAGVGALVAIFPLHPKAGAPGKSAQTAPDPSAGLVLISESDRIEAISDDGWREDAQGAAMRSIRLHYVEENKVRDKESGMIMRITEPREEVLLVPVDSF
jgi:hypothetical protein